MVVAVSTLLVYEITQHFPVCNSVEHNSHTADFQYKKHTITATGMLSLLGTITAGLFGFPF